MNFNFNRNTEKTIVLKFGTSVANKFNVSTAMPARTLTITAKAATLKEILENTQSTKEIADSIKNLFIYDSGVWKEIPLADLGKDAKDFTAKELGVVLGSGTLASKQESKRWFNDAIEALLKNKSPEDALLFRNIITLLKKLSTPNDNTKTLGILPKPAEILYNYAIEKASQRCEGFNINIAAYVDGVLDEEARNSDTITSNTISDTTSDSAEKRIEDI